MAVHCEMGVSPARTYISGVGINFWDAAGWDVQPDFEVTKTFIAVQITMEKCMTLVQKGQTSFVEYSVDASVGWGTFKWGMGAYQILQ